MTTDTPSNAVAEAAGLLLQRFDRHVVALMAYGSRICGEARTGSEYDFWLVARDPEAFHNANSDFYAAQLNVPSTPEEQIRLNRVGPLFYSIRLSGFNLKVAVIGEDDLVRLCAENWWTVKGRMQKPLLIFRSTPAVRAAVLGARREGLLNGINLLPPSFALDELLKSIVGLSYRAEIRPENKNAKIRSILRAGGPQLVEIYEPLLNEIPWVRREGERWTDLRPAEERSRARISTLRALRRSKFSRRSFRFIWRNFRSHRTPIWYIVLKISGEIEKTAKRWFRRGAA